MILRLFYGIGLHTAGQVSLPCASKHADEFYRLQCMVVESKVDSESELDITDNIQCRLQLHMDNMANSNITTVIQSTKLCKEDQVTIGYSPDTSIVAVIFTNVKYSSLSVSVLG